MKRPDIAEDIIPLGEFEAHSTSLLRRLHATGRPLVLTRRGRAEAVVLSPEEFEQLAYGAQLHTKIQAGIEDAKTRTYSAEEVLQRVGARIRAAGRAQH